LGSKTFESKQFIPSDYDNDKIYILDLYQKMSYNEFTKEWEKLGVVVVLMRTNATGNNSTD